jgi:hypothetical protein
MKKNNGIHKKGDIVEIRASNTPFGGKEPDSFVLIEVPDIPMTAYRKYNMAYNTEISFSIVGHNAELDGYRLRLFSNLSSNFIQQIGIDKITAFIEKWGGTVFSIEDDAVIFDLSIFGALKSAGFWDISPENIVFTELDYNTETGMHRIELDYSALGNNPSYVETYIEQRGLVAITHNNRVLTFDADSNIVKAEFEKDIEEKSKTMVARRRYYIPENIVDLVIANSGMYTTDETTLLSYVMDKNG